MPLYKIDRTVSLTMVLPVLVRASSPEMALRKAKMDTEDVVDTIPIRAANVTAKVIHHEREMFIEDVSRNLSMMSLYDNALSQINR